jgi:hypothetical protein
MSRVYRLVPFVNWGRVTGSRPGRNVAPLIASPSNIQTHKVIVLINTHGFSDATHALAAIRRWFSYTDVDIWALKSSYGRATHSVKNCLG